MGTDMRALREVARMLAPIALLLASNVALFIALRLLLGGHR